MKTDAALPEMGLKTPEEKKDDYVRSVMALMCGASFSSFGGAADPAISR